MFASDLAASLPPAQRLALAYAPRAAREDWLALFAFDARLAAIVRRAREPLPAQLRLAWWRERLGEDQALWPLGEPLLALLARRGAVIPALPALVDAWEGLLAEPPLDAAVHEALAAARGATCALLDGGAGDAGHDWALVEQAGQVPPGDAREALRQHLRAREWSLAPARGPLRVLHGLARRAIDRPDLALLAGPRDLAAAMRIGLLGR